MHDARNSLAESRWVCAILAAHRETMREPTRVGGPGSLQPANLGRVNRGITHVSPRAIQHQLAGQISVSGGNGSEKVDEVVEILEGQRGRLRACAGGLSARHGCEQQGYTACTARSGRGGRSGSEAMERTRGWSSVTIPASSITMRSLPRCPLSRMLPGWRSPWAKLS